MSTAGTAPIAALNFGISPVTVTWALQELPPLQAGPTRCPCSSKMPMLHGVLVRSALAVAVRCTPLPAPSPWIVTESHVSDTGSDWANVPCAGRVEDGFARTATTERTPLTGCVREVEHEVPWLQNVSRALLSESKSWSWYPVLSMAEVVVAVMVTVRPGPTIASFVASVTPTQFTPTAFDLVVRLPAGILVDGSVT